MPLATWVVRDTLLLALCCDHFMHNSWVFVLLLFYKQRKENGYIYIHTYIISTYTYICICLQYISKAGNSSCHEIQPACMQKFLAGPSSALGGVEGPGMFRQPHPWCFYTVGYNIPSCRSRNNGMRASLCLQHISVPFASTVKL